MTENWTRQAACVGVDPEIFFVVAEAGGVPDWSPARRVCARCPVKQECRDANDRIEAVRPSSETQGMYAGETPKERRARRRRTHQGAIAKVPGGPERDLTVLQRALERAKYDLTDEMLRAEPYAGVWETWC